MKSPRDLAKRMKSRESENFHRETLRLPISQARKHVKQLFSEFPSATFMTEIEAWQEIEGVVEFKTTRLKHPIDEL